MWTVSAVVFLTFEKFEISRCQQFSPQLTQFVSDNQENISMIFVSADHSERSMIQFVASKPFLTLGFNDPVRQSIMNILGVRMFPTLIIVDADTGKVLTRWGRLMVLNEKAPGALVRSWLKGSSGIETMFKTWHVLLFLGLVLFIMHLAHLI